MNWHNWITDGYAAREHGTEMRPDFRGGASPQRIAEVEAELGLRLPDPLSELLQESDGVGESMDYAGTWIDLGEIIWSCDNITAKNKSIRADKEDYYAPPPGAPGTVALFIAGAGVDGVLFAFFLHDSGPADLGIYAYHPIEYKWTLVSPSLAVHVLGWVI